MKRRIPLLNLAGRIVACLLVVGILVLASVSGAEQTSQTASNQSAAPGSARVASASVSPSPSATAKPSPAPSPTPTAKSKAKAPATAAEPGGRFVTQNGTGLVLGDQAFRFAGLNLFMANSRDNCGPSLGASPALGRELDQWGDGQNVIRTWFFQSLATKNGQRDWAAFDHTLATARAQGLHVIATLGNQWGECENGVYKTAGWYQSGYRSSTDGGTVAYRQWVAEVTARYRDEPAIMAWQLVNEAETATSAGGDCAAGGAATLRAFADDVGGLVHRTDPNHLVSLGTIGSGQCGASGDDYGLVHASPAINLCEYHDYSGTDTMPGDQWNGLARRIEQCRALGKPLFVGEIGITLAEAGGSAQTRANAFAAKLQAWSRAGIAGGIAWAWRSDDGYGVSPGDPALTAIAPR